jgi:hypothetical protein
MQEQVCKDPERGNEESRAAVYGLKPSDLIDEPLVVPPGKHLLLQPDKGEGGQGYVRLDPKDLDDVKRWIGVPDEVGAKRSCCAELPAEIPGLASAGDLRRQDPKTQRAIHDLAYQYVHGDARRLVAYKPVLNHLIDRAYVIGVFLRQDIDIHNGSVLEIGKSVKILFARHVRIWRGGLLKVSGDAKIDCVSITGDVTGAIHHIDKVALIGRVLN